VLQEVGPGSHDLRVAAQGKKNYEQEITVSAGQTANIQATLAALGGSVRVQTTPGAEVFLDNASRGMADAAGQLVLQEVAPGSHDLHISGRGKREFRQSIAVQAGQQSRVVLAAIWRQGLAAGEVMVNPIDELRYVWIPPGTFMMGCSPGDSECIDWEKPAHQVMISKGFWIGRTPVTVGAYKRFAGATGRQMPPAPDFNNGWTNENVPIVGVTWDDAQTYCRWVGGRLPTEAEWEYAARGGNAEARYGPIDEIAWYRDNSGGRIHDVAQKGANGFGLFDMLGNVGEWVNDWFNPNYYQVSPSQDPQGVASGQARVGRGGTWGHDASSVRASYRGWGAPADVNNWVFGFRCGGEVGNP
jgi:formylglycine-generating enzyme required for sulfatase activity